MLTTLKDLGEVITKFLWHDITFHIVLNTILGQVFNGKWLRLARLGILFFSE